jgi:hypothetical protein
MCAAARRCRGAWHTEHSGALIGRARWRHPRRCLPYCRDCIDETGPETPGSAGNGVVAENAEQGARPAALRDLQFGEPSARWEWQQLAMEDAGLSSEQLAVAVGSLTQREAGGLFICCST